MSRYQEIQETLEQLDLPGYTPAEDWIEPEDGSFRPSRRYHQRYRRAAVKSYWDFIKLIQYRGGPNNFGAIHYELAQWLQSAGHRRLVLMPRGHLKSTLCSVGYVLWRIYCNPNIRILVGTATKPLALSFVREVKQYLEDPELTEKVWNNRPHINGPLIPDLDRSSKPRSRRVKGDDENFEEEVTDASDKKIVWSATQLQVNRDKIMREPTLVASSVNVQNTGFHFDLAIFDDVVTFDNSSNFEKTEKIISWVADMESVIDPRDPETDLGDEVVMLGTRYYHRDLYGLFSREDLSPDEQEDLAEDGSTGFISVEDDWQMFKRNVYANGKDEANGFLWPERFNERVIAKIRARMARLPNGAQRFASQYLNAIIAQEDVVLDPSLIQYFQAQWLHAKDKDGCCKLQAKSIDEPIYLKPYIVVDPAISLKKHADNTVVACGAVDEKQSLYLFDMKAGKLKTTEVIAAIYDMVEKYGVYSVYIENEKLGQALMQSIRNEWRGNRQRQPLVLLPYQAKGDKKQRIASTLQPRFVNHQIHLVNWLSRLNALQEEIMFFPRENAHDDCLDAMTMLCDVALPKRTKVLSKAGNHSRRFNMRYGGIR